MIISSRNYFTERAAAKVFCYNYKNSGLELYKKFILGFYKEYIYTFSLYFCVINP